MNEIDRRNFLVRTGLALGSALLTADLPFPKFAASTDPSLHVQDWPIIRGQFPLSRDLIHLAGFFLASHPIAVRDAHDRIEAWRREYNQSRPHRALRDRTPDEFAKAVAENQLREALITAGNSP
jgi:hypothetical protein